MKETAEAHPKLGCRPSQMFCRLELLQATLFLSSARCHGRLCLVPSTTLALNFGGIYRNKRQLDFFKDCPKLKNLKLTCHRIEKLVTISGPETKNLQQKEIEVEIELLQSPPNLEVTAANSKFGGG